MLKDDLDRNSTKSPSLGNIASVVQKIGQTQNLPPIHKWNPPFCGDIDMKITRDGRWYYNGTSIERKAMVQLFSSVLRRDDDDCYYLVTPVEKVRIQVEDVPFVAVQLHIKKNEELTEYSFTTNVGDEIILNKEHQLRVTINSKSGEPMPYLRVRDKLDAVLHRNVFYQLVNESKPVHKKGMIEFHIASQGITYSLGSIAE